MNAEGKNGLTKKTSVFENGLICYASTADILKEALARCSFLPRSKESNERKRTAKVLVLIPPAVEPEEPPTNMSAMVVKMTTFLTAPGPESGSAGAS